MIVDIKKGEMVGIIGKSGAGKSTIANIILSLLAPFGTFGPIPQKLQIYWGVR